MDDYDKLLKDISRVTGIKPKPREEKQPLSRSPIEGADVATVVNDELAKLGWSDNARLSFLGDMGRENSWNRKTIFGGHADPKNQAFNRGIISWQGDRRKKLDNYLKQQGLLGRNDDEELRGMVRFMDEEMRSNPEWKGVYSAVRSPDISTYDASENLRRYIKYVPDAPYNSYDPEFRVKNNRDWALKAKKLGLISPAQSADYGGLLDDIKKVTDAPEDYSDILSQIKSVTGVETPTVPGVQTLKTPEIPQELKDLKAIQSGNVQVGQTDFGQTLPDIPAPPLAPQLAAPQYELIQQTPKVIGGRGLVDSETASVAPFDTESEYKKYLAYTKKADSPETRAEFESAVQSFDTTPGTSKSAGVAKNQISGAAAMVEQPAQQGVQTPAQSPTTITSRQAPMTAENVQNEGAKVKTIKAYRRKPTPDEVYKDSLETAYGQNVFDAMRAYKDLTGQDLIVPVHQDWRERLAKDIDSYWNPKTGEYDNVGTERYRYAEEVVDAYNRGGVRALNELLQTRNQNKLQAQEETFNDAEIEEKNRQAILERKTREIAGEYGTISPTSYEVWKEIAKRYLSNPINLMHIQRGGVVVSPALMTIEDRNKLIREAAEEEIRNAGSAARAEQLRREYESLSTLQKTSRHYQDFLSTIKRTPATFARTIAWAEDTASYFRNKGILIPGLTATLTSADILNAVDWVQSKITGKERKGYKQGYVPELIAAQIEQWHPDDEVTRNTFLGKLSRAAGSAVPFLIGAVASGGSSSVIGLLGVGMSVGEQYKQAQDVGLSREKQILAGATGIPLGLTELLGLRYAKLGQLINGKSNGAFVKSFMDFLRQTGKEATEESLQEFFQSASGKLVIEGLKKNGLTREDVERALGSSIDDALTGGIVGAIFGAGGAALSNAQGRKQGENIPSVSPQPLQLPGQNYDVDGEIVEDEAKEQDVKSTSQPSQVISQPALPKPAFEVRRDTRLKELGYTEPEINDMTGAEKQEIVDLNKGVEQKAEPKPPIQLTESPIANEITPEVSQSSAPLPKENVLPQAEAVQAKAEPVLTPEQEAKINKIANRRTGKAPMANPERHSLAQFVALSGGIKPGVVLDTNKLNKLKFGIRPLVSEKGKSAEDMMRNAIEAGYLSGIARGYNQAENANLDFSPNDFIDAVEYDFRKGGAYHSEAYHAKNQASIEDAQYEFYRQKEQERRLEQGLNDLSDDEYNKVATITDYLADAEVQKILEQAEKTGALDEKQRDELLQIGYYEKGLDKRDVERTIQSIERELRQAASERIAPETPASLTESAADSNRVSETLYTPVEREDLDESEPEGEVDLSFDFGEAESKPIQEASSLPFSDKEIENVFRYKTDISNIKRMLRGETDARSPVIQEFEKRIANAKEQIREYSEIGTPEAFKRAQENQKYILIAQMAVDTAKRAIADKQKTEPPKEKPEQLSLTADQLVQQEYAPPRNATREQLESAARQINNEKREKIVGRDLYTQIIGNNESDVPAQARTVAASVYTYLDKLSKSDVDTQVEIGNKLRRELPGIFDVLDVYKRLLRSNTPVSDYLKQDNLFGERELTPEQEKLLTELANLNSKAKTDEFIQNRFGEIKTPDSQAGLFQTESGERGEGETKDSLFDLTPQSGDLPDITSNRTLQVLRPTSIGEKSRKWTVPVKEYIDEYVRKGFTELRAEGDSFVLVNPRFKINNKSAKFQNPSELAYIKTVLAQQKSQEVAQPARQPVAKESRGKYGMFHNQLIREAVSADEAVRKNAFLNSPKVRELTGVGESATPAQVSEALKTKIYEAGKVKFRDENTDATRTDISPNTLIQFARENNLPISDLVKLKRAELETRKRVGEKLFLSPEEIEESDIDTVLEQYAKVRPSAERFNNLSKTKKYEKAVEDWKQSGNDLAFLSFLSKEGVESSYAQAIIKKSKELVKGRADERVGQVDENRSGTGSLRGNESERSGESEGQDAGSQEVDKVIEAPKGDRLVTDISKGKTSGIKLARANNFTADLASLSDKEIYQKAAITPYKVDEDGIVLDQSHLEILKRLDNVDGDFDGVDYDLPESLSIADDLEWAALNQPEAVADFLFDFARDIRKIAKRDGGTSLFTPDRRHHEVGHRASDLGSGGKPLHERVDVDALRESEEFSYAHQHLLNLGYPNKPAVLVEEMMRHIEEERYDRIGLTEKQARNFAKKWYNSFAEKGGDLTIKQFDRAAKFTKKELENARKLASKNKQRREREQSGNDRSYESRTENGRLDSLFGEGRRGSGRISDKSLGKQTETEARRRTNLEPYQKPEQTALVKSESNRSPFEWAKDFPVIVPQSTGIKVKSHKDYKAAKAGDINAAMSVVEDTVKTDKISALAVRHAGAIVIPVHAQEQAGKNKLPAALAGYIAAKTGLTFDDTIVQTNKTSHTGADAVHRLFAVPEFTGEVIKGKEYILIDDAATSGSTFKALKEYIESGGGRVVEAVTLFNASHPQTGYGGYLAIRPETVAKLGQLFDINEFDKLLLEYGIAPNIYGLTNGQGSYFATFRSIAGIRNKFAQRGFAPSDRYNAGKMGQVSNGLESSQSEVTQPPSKDRGLYARAPKKQNKTEKAVDVFLDVVSSVKSLKATADLSAAGRQGWILSLTHPKTAYRSFIRQLQSLTDRGYAKFKRDLDLHPYIELAEASDLYLSTLADPSNINEREEAFMSRLFADDPYFKNNSLEKLRRGATYPVRKAENAYKTYLDNLRISAFSMFAQQVGQRLVKEGADKETIEQEMKGIARFVNYATGRGSWGSPMLNATFFSTRYWESRVQLLNPVFYGKLPPRARRIALKNMAAFVGATALLMLLWKLMDGEFEWDDIDNPNALKLKHGNYSYDIGAGLIQHLRYFGRMVNATQDKDAGRKMSHLTERYVRGKLSPVAGSVWNIAEGKNFIGEPTSLKEEVVGKGGLFGEYDPLTGGGLASPISFSNFYEAAKEDGSLGLIKTLPEFVGFGVTRYKKPSEIRDEIKKEREKPATTPAERKEKMRRLKAWNSLLERAQKQNRKAQ